MSDAPDQAARDQVVSARGASVLIDAGAGAGKTTLLVERILALIAPADDRIAHVPLSRLAAVTFTRRAAGELRLRVRARILSELAKPGGSAIRTERLILAIGSIDEAFLGTIHGFADRLLRLLPMKARISPAYLIADDVDALVDETVESLLYSVQNGTLAAELDDQPTSYITIVERTLQEALRAGLLVRSIDRDPAPPKVGLDLLFRGFIEQRDRDLAWDGGGRFDRRAFDQTAREICAATAGMGERHARHALADRAGDAALRVAVRAGRSGALRGRRSHQARQQGDQEDQGFP